MKPFYTSKKPKAIRPRKSLNKIKQAYYFIGNYVDGIQTISSNPARKQKTFGYHELMPKWQNWIQLLREWLNQKEVRWANKELQQSTMPMFYLSKL